MQQCTEPCIHQSHFYSVAKISTDSIFKWCLSVGTIFWANRFQTEEVKSENILISVLHGSNIPHPWNINLLAPELLFFLLLAHPVYKM
jgi:hypothetical protein